jgi:hypothetical protein
MREVVRPNGSLSLALMQVDGDVDLALVHGDQGTRLTPGLPPSQTLTPLISTVTLFGS